MRSLMRLPQGSGSSSRCDSNRDACWQEMRNIGLLARERLADIATTESALLETRSQHHACPVKLDPHIGRAQAQILTQLLGIAAEHFAQHEQLSGPFRQFFHAALHGGEKAVLLAQI